MNNNQEKGPGRQAEQPDERNDEAARKGYAKDVILAGETPDGIGDGDSNLLPRGKASTGVKDDSVGQYVGPDGADGSGGDDETLERITGQNVVP
jgi:hypothetical protein